ncbi:MAG TPA: alpha/beta hydrolase, partial [Mucilaginibacter sp.]|nr:alpha/beta hydrolase [Mucilaginibacter sp.]
PMVMLIHGGTFLNGKKEEMATLCRQMADSGFVAITINYRLGWDFATLSGGCATLDVDGLTLANYRAIQDAHAAMRFVAANADKYHVDKNWLFMGGGSAGAITALNVAYNTDKKMLNELLAATVAKLGDIDTASNAYTTKFKIKGICDLWGALSDSTLINKKTALPTIFYHGTADKLVPYDHGYYVPGCTRLRELFGSACLYRQTRAAGQVAVFNTSVGGKHGPTEFTAAVIASNTACFFHRIMNGTAMSAAYYDGMTGCR